MVTLVGPLWVSILFKPKPFQDVWPGNATSLSIVSVSHSCQDIGQKTRKPPCDPKHLETTCSFGALNNSNVEALSAFNKKKQKIIELEGIKLNHLQAEFGLKLHLRPKHLIQDSVGMCRSCPVWTLIRTALNMAWCTKSAARSQGADQPISRSGNQRF